MSRLVAENEAALQQAIGQNFKTDSREQIFETLACLGEIAFRKNQLEEWMKPIDRFRGRWPLRATAASFIAIPMAWR